MATDKQKQWQRRGQLLWRLKGFKVKDFMQGVPLTPIEKVYLNKALGLIDYVIDDFAYNSKKLGFNVKERNK